MDFADFLDRLLCRFQPYYDIQKGACLNGMFINAEARFHSRSEKYVLSPSAKLWGYETNDYAYFICRDFDDIEEFKNMRNAVLSDGLNKVNPHKEHMFSDVTMVLISHGISKEIQKEIKKFKFSKTYRFNFYGRMYFKIAAVDLNGKTVIHNPRGRDLKKPLLTVLKSYYNTEASK